MYVRAVDAAGNKDLLYVLNHNVYEWHYVSPAPLDIIFGVIGAFFGALFLAWLEQKRRQRKRAMEVFRALFFLSTSPPRLSLSLWLPVRAHFITATFPAPSHASPLPSPLSPLTSHPTPHPTPLSLPPLLATLLILSGTP